MSTNSPIDHYDDLSAVARALGKRGGLATAAKMTPAQLVARAKKAGLAQKASRKVRANAKKTKHL